MSVPLFDLSRQRTQSPSLHEATKEAVLRVLDHQEFILGKEVLIFEKEVEKRCLEAILPQGETPESASPRMPQAIGTSSGTDALLALLIAKNIGAGDAVITTPYTFFATAGCIHRVGAEIIFCDIDPATYMMDPEKLRLILGNLKRETSGVLRSAHGNHVKMVMPIHLFGTCCDMDAIMAIAKEYHLMVIEDAAQVLGADYPSIHGPKKAGAIAEMSYFSFYPTKNLGAAGDAGLAVALDPEVADQVRLIRNHGMEERYYHKVVGGNFRLDAIQAAILRVRLPYIDQWNEQRRNNAAIYKNAFAKAGLLSRIHLPSEPWAASGLKNHHIYHQYVIRIVGSADQGPQAGLRETIMAHLKKKQIGYAIYYPVPLHLQECFAYLGHKKKDFIESERAALETLALPIFPELSEKEINTVVASIAEAIS
ncbi:MAG: DegT/DnrJ/EryC1/StrS family aminotransferase [Verrucomicrobia bacterium]|nr:MAG: DegT/DnrJ/EryC1/StrS family aminotransferase [Verrucomicrobiota bacterium]